MSNFISDNGGPIAVGAVILAVIVGYAELRLPNMVEAAVRAEMVERGVVPKSEHDALVDDVEDVEEDVGDLRRRWNAFVDAIAAAGRSE